LSLNDPQRRATDGTRARIVEALRRGPLTIDELAQEVGLTRTAIRSQITALLSEGLIEPRELRPGPSKPSQTYGITTTAKLRLSRAYVPILIELFQVLAEDRSAADLDRVMREVGRRLARTYPHAHGSIRERMLRGSELLKELGGLTEVTEEKGKLVILGHGCPLAAATRTHPEACNIVESLLTEVVGERVTKCCDRYQRERCCFEVSAGAA
jgi:predicted ArsR family transcriptional regulator